MSHKVIFTAPYSPTFVRQDIDLLNNHYQVITDILPWQKKWLYPFLVIAQFGRLIFLVPTCQVIICSFGGYWCLVPTILGKIFRKPVYIILHGTDCCKAPKINYGALRKLLVHKACQFSYKNASILLPVSSSLMWSNDNYSQQLIGKQGVRTHFPHLSPKHAVISNGIDCNFWNYEHTERRSIQFITVMDEQQFERRDGSRLFSFFEKNSHLALTIVGSVPKSIEPPKNVVVKQWMQRSQLKKLFCKSQYYIQLSLYEGFGCSLAEAMACGCIPIGTSVNSVSDIIGETGLVIEKRSLVEDKISTFLKTEVTNEMRIAARNHIIDNYSVTKREKALTSLIG